MEFFKEDRDRLDKNLYFQQDNATCHVGKKSKEYINSNFHNKLDFWPPNSADLSPIESVWAEVQAKLVGYTFKCMEDFRMLVLDVVTTEARMLDVPS